GGAGPRAGGPVPAGPPVVAGWPWLLPERGVGVAHAPPTEMCGSEARLGSALPAAFSRCASSPYVLPAPTVTAAAAESMSQTAGSPAVAMSTPSVSAMRLNECLVPRARTRVLSATMDRSPATVYGLRTSAARNSTFPAQLAGPAGRRRWVNGAAWGSASPRSGPARQGKNDHAQQEQGRQDRGHEQVVRWSALGSVAAHT